MEGPASGAKRRWETFPHGADIGVRGRGPDLERAFEGAAMALTSVTSAPERVLAARQVSFECEAPDLELLLFEWLNALIYEMDVRRMLFGRFEVELDAEHRRLRARAWGEEVDIARHEPGVEIKGATLTALEVARDEDGSWCAQCVVDV